jgi:hypothetical protein
LVEDIVDLDKKWEEARLEEVKVYLQKSDFIDL